MRRMIDLTIKIVINNILFSGGEEEKTKLTFGLKEVVCRTA
jgi:hypothetical protein